MPLGGGNAVFQDGDGHVGYFARVEGAVDPTTGEAVLEIAEAEVVVVEVGL